MNTDQQIPHGEYVGYEHVDDDGETRLEIADFVTPPLTKAILEKRLRERQARGDD